MGVNDTDVATFGALWFHHLSYPHELLEAFKFNEKARSYLLLLPSFPHFWTSLFAPIKKPPNVPRGVPTFGFLPGTQPSTS
jgi:hypothetical protein